MIFGKGEYGPIIYVYHEILRGVPVAVVHKTPNVLHKYTIMKCHFWPDIR